jgi:hypothetical protein
MLCEWRIELNYSRFIGFGFFIEVLIGAYLAYLFSPIDYPKQFADLMNLFGLFLDFIGVVLLSDHFINIPSRYSHAHEMALSMVLGLPFMMSIGGATYSIIAFGLGWPVSMIWAIAVGIVVLYVGLALYGFDSIADALQFKFMENSVIRVSYYGWFLLLSGLVMQIYASIVHLGIT